MDNPALVSFLLILGGIIAIEIGFSAAVLELVAGALAANAFGIGPESWIDFLGNFGLLAIMFLAGFELKVDYVMEKIGAISAIAVAAFAVPFCAVFILTFFLLGYGQPSSLLMATALSTTSIALVYPFLKEKRILERNEGSLMIASAASIDMLSMFAMALIFGSGSFALLLVVPFFLLGVKGLPKIAKALFARYKGNIAEIELKFILFVLLGIAVFAETVQIHAAIFVFFIGVVFSEVLQDYKTIEKKLRGITFAFMAPLFFFKAGMLFDLSLFTYDAAFLTALLVVVGFVAKYVPTYLVANRFISRKYSRIMACAFSYRLSFSVIAAVFGLENGLISTQIYSAILATVAMLAIVPSLILRETPSEIEG